MTPAQGYEADRILPFEKVSLNCRPKKQRDRGWGPWSLGYLGWSEMKAGRSPRGGLKAKLRSWDLLPNHLSLKKKSHSLGTHFRPNELDFLRVGRAICIF